MAACRDAGVTRLVCVGTDPEASEQALSLARSSRQGAYGEKVPEVWATVGLHPHEAAKHDVDAVSRILEASRPTRAHVTGGVSRSGDLPGGRAGAGDEVVVAVGECGLDFHHDHSPREAQREAFAAQIGLAHQHNLALVVHARAAWDDLFDILAAEGVPSRSVVHCFTGGPEEARRSLDLGMWLSFSGIVTFKRAGDVRQAAALCPLDRLLIETDSPFLAPVPYRGRPNRPALVPLVGAAVAAARGLEPEAVAEASWRAASQLFAV